MKGTMPHGKTNFRSLFHGLVDYLKGHVMSNDVIPPSVKLAAKRGFIRTTAQAYAATLTAGLVASVVSLITDPGNWLTVVVAVATAVVTPPVAGLTSYLNITANGLPEDYVPAAVNQNFVSGLTLRADLDK